MFQEKTFIAIIPARGGSKRLPKKNKLNLGGKPLISWTIDSAKKCKFLDEVMVTTDDPEIRDLAIACGANSPFLRPEYLATDEASSYDAIIHTIEFYKKQLKREFDFVVILQPTSPFRTGGQITEAILLLAEKSASSIISICKAHHSPLWMNSMPENMSMNNFISDSVKNTRSQDLTPHYQLNGAIFICEIKKLIAEKTFFLKSNSFAYEMNRETSLDIDDSLDFKFAEFIISRMSEESLT